jgi:tetratricopeptide (TPR) repeat protein
MMPRESECERPISPEETIALLVGVDKYSAGDHWSLDGPARDALRMATWLSSRGVPPGNVHLLVSTAEPILGLLTNVTGARREDFRRVATGILPSSDCKLLWFHWGGHGVVDTNLGRRLFYADASAGDRLNLDFDDFLRTLKTSLFPSLERVIASVDACATFDDDARARSSLPHDVLPHGVRRRGMTQYVLFAAQTGEVAPNDDQQSTGVFSRNYMNLLEKSSGWPPNMHRLHTRLWKALAQENLADPASPTYLWEQDAAEGQQLWEAPQPTSRRSMPGGQSTVNNLPPSSPLVGREQILIPILAAISGRRISPRTQVIHGMAGVGKTAIVVEIAKRLSIEYQDCQIYIDLHGYTHGESELDASEALGSLLCLIGLHPSSIPNSLSDRSSLWRREMSSRRAIIVVDNARTADRVEPLLVSGDHVACLVTSRKRIQDLPGAEPRELGCLGSNESSILLWETSGRVRSEPEPEAFGEILRVCAGLPLALQLAGSQLRRRPALSLETYSARLVASKAFNDPGAGDRGTRRVFDSSYTALSAPAQRLYRALGLNPGPSFTMNAAMSLLESDDIEAAGLLDEIFEGHLLEELQEGRYTIHDLLRDHSVEIGLLVESDKERSASSGRLMDYWIANSEAATRACDAISLFEVEHSGITTFPIYGSSEQGRAWFETEWPNLRATLRYLAASGDHMRVIRLAAACAGHLRARGLYSEAVEVHSAALESASELRSGVARALAHENLGAAHLDGGNFRSAILHLNAALKSWRRLIDREGETRVLDCRGFTFERMGDYPRALRDLGKAKELSDSLGNQKGLSLALNGLGAVYWRLGRYDDALSAFTEALEIRVLLGDRAAEARTRNNIGFTYQRLGSWRDAERYLMDAETIALEVGDRQVLSTITNNFGYLWASAGRPLSGIRAAKRGLSLSRTLGSRYEEARALDALSRACACAGHRGWARTIGEMAVVKFGELGVPEAGALREFLERET